MRAGACSLYRDLAAFLRPFLTTLWMRCLASPSGRWDWWWWWPGGGGGGEGLRLLFAVLLVLTSLAEVRHIPSSSMVPTMCPGDRIICEKVSYHFRSPAIDDIVLFRVPKFLEGNGYKNGDVFIKRIVAVAGDLVEVKGGLVFVNTVARKEKFVAEPSDYRIRATRVPAGHVFVMGDNRNNSFDSHNWGPLPVADIVGNYYMHFFRAVDS